MNKFKIPDNVTIGEIKRLQGAKEFEEKLLALREKADNEDLDGPKKEVKGKP